MARKLTDTVHLRLRFDEKLRRRLERSAEDNKQSMNAEIIQRLEQSFRKEDEKRLINEARMAFTAVLEQKFRVVPIGAAGEGQLHPEPAKPANANQEDKGR
jgi:hypothetical protein